MRVGVIFTKPQGLRVGKEIPQKTIGTRYKKRGETLLDAQYTRWVLWSFRSPPILLSHCHTPAFAISFCWSELSAEIQVTHCFLEQVIGTGHECLELPLAWCHNQELSLDTDTSAKEGFSWWSVAPLWQEEILYFLYAGLELGCIKASGGKTKEIRMEFFCPLLLLT